MLIYAYTYTHVCLPIYTSPFLQHIYINLYIHVWMHDTKVCRPLKVTFYCDNKKGPWTCVDFPNIVTLCNTLH